MAAADLRLRGDLIGEGYGVLSAPVRDAMELVARTEGIVLDPVYTGRAAAGLPGLFGHPDMNLR